MKKPQLYRSFCKHCHVWLVCLRLWLMVSILAVAVLPAIARNPDYTENADNSRENADNSRDHAENYAESEILITLNVPRVGNTELPAIIFGQDVYLPVKELFDFLKIKNTVSNDLDSISGFFINPEATFLVDKDQHQIHYRGNVYHLKHDDLVQTETGLFLKLPFYSQVFGLDCNFSFRSLSITLTTKIELPAIREMQLEIMRRNITKLKGDKRADTSFKRSYPMLQFGAADWLVVSNQQTGFKPTTRVNLGLGGIIAGGEASVNLNYTTGYPFEKRQQYYKWRYVNNENKLVKQTTAGKIFTQSTASLFSPVNGIQFTNAPTTYRRSFGSYTLSDKTEPGWTVELYVNNILVSYVKADASGFFTFEVPLIYGNSIIKLRFFGPWGEERTTEQNINIPFNFMPVDQFEYSVTAGIVDDETKAKFARANFNYGFNKFLTMGGGLEYLSSIASGKYLPYVNASLRVGSNVLVSAERTFGVRTKGFLNYKNKKNIQLDLNYTRYDEGQTAIKFNYIEEKKAMLSIPLRSRHVSAFTRFTVSQVTLPKTKNTLAEMLVSAQVFGVNANLTTFAIISDPTDKLIYTNLSLTFRAPGGIRITPQAQYEYREKAFSQLRTEMEKKIGRQSYLNFSYQNNLKTRVQTFGLGFRFNFSFAQASMQTTVSEHNVSSYQFARGSLLVDSKTGGVTAGNQSGVGKGSLSIIAFLDLNGNGKRDAGEPKLDGLNLKINGGKMIHNEGDTSILIINLEAYNNYFVEVDNNSFDNIAWRLKYKNFNIVADPNLVKHVDIPVAVVGEVSGNVNLTSRGLVKGVARVIVNIYDANEVLVAKTLSESDGYFYYLGLLPGTYTAVVDQKQLAGQHLVSLSDEIEFTIKPSKEGDMVGGITFDVRRL